MRSRLSRVLAGVMTSALAVGVVASLAADADAQRRGRRGRRQAQQPQRAPMSDAIGPALQGIEWGWSPDKLMEHHRRKIRSEFQPRINKARDAMTEDRLRHQRDQILRRMRESFIEFNGQTTGYDSGFLRDEFTHGNREAMLRVRGENGDDYYFFIQGRLWKWFHAFDASVFQGADFEQFTQALQGRFGEGLMTTGAPDEGADERQWMEWQDETTRVRAMDNTTFYGFYSLVFEDKRTLSRLDQLRTNRRRRGRRSHALVDAVTGDGDEAANSDANPDIVDRITGNIRRWQDAPDDDE